MRPRRPVRLGNSLHRQTRGLRLEPLESRTLLSATPTDDSFRLSIWVDSDEVAIPADLGVASDDSTQSLFTVEAGGEVYLDTPSGQTLGDLFDIWQNNAGVAGNRADAILTEDQLLDNIEDGTKTVQMFVNGQVSTEFDEYVVQDGDEIILIYGDNPVLSLNTNFGPIVVELFVDDTPITVDNFLNYVNDGDYINSFFHRSAKISGADFVIQGGGFRTTSTTFTSTAQFSEIPDDGTIQNEPGISNLRGTIAMAKVGGNPNSATNQFFVNLTNNHATSGASLDTQNGGFTVFGQVLDMTTADAIADLPVNTSNVSPYGELPLGTGNQLVVVQSVTGQGEISGKKYLDENGDGSYDNGEQLLAGVTVYLDANDNGVLDSGEIWTLTDTNGTYRFQVEAGDYIVRAEVEPGRFTTEPTSPDSHPVTVEIGRETTDIDFGENLVAPSGIDLLADSDTGDADDDDRTSNNNAGQDSVLQFLVSGVNPGAEVQLFADGTLIGSAVATTDEVTVTTDGTHTLADGARNITARQVSGGTSALSDPLVVTIDTTGPAGLTNEVTDIAQVGVAYSFNAESPEEGDITYSLSGAPTGMTIDAATGQIAWTPNTDQAVPHEFDIVLTDSAGNTTSESVLINVLGAVPAYPDEYSVNEDTTLTVNAAGGVLANDDTTSGELTVATIDLPSHGNLTLHSDGSFVYTPAAGFFGTDTFTYQATNSTGDESNIASVTITINAVNDPPVAVANSYTTTEDTTLNVTAAQGVLANDSDFEDDILTAVLVTPPAHGTITLNSNGSFSYVPNANYAGTDSFTYKANDGTDDSAAVTVSLTVTAVNDAPDTVTDSYTMNEDGTLTVNAANGFLSNDSDAEGDSFTGTIVSHPAHGELTFNSDGSFVYTPDANYFGTDTFTYRATDGSATSDPTTVAITINGTDDPPTAVNDTFTAPNDGTSVLIDVLDNDTDPDGTGSLTITAVTQGSKGGTVTIDGNQLRYTAVGGFTGTETITYTITDGDGLTDTATLTVTAVDASDNTISGFVYIDTDGDGKRDSGEMGVPGVLVTLTGTDNFGNSVLRTALTSLDGSYTFEELTAGTYQLRERQPTALTDGKDSSAASGAVVGNDVISNLVISDSGVFANNNFGEAALKVQYISIRMFLASAGTMQECLRDSVAQAEAMAGHGDLAEAIRNGDTSYDDGTNNAPVAANDSYSVNEDTKLTIVTSQGVLANDTDADGDSLVATLVSGVAHGTLKLNSGGSFTYKPDANFHGTDSFTYKATDGLGGSDTATVTITVTAVNDVPVATADSYNATANTTLTVNTTSGLLANDSDADGNTLTATKVSDVSHGDLTLNPNGSFTYVPDTDFHGTDTFTYRVNDGTANSATATVTIVVNALPEAENDSYSVTEDQTLTVTAANGVLKNDTDADGNTLTASVTVQPLHGTLNFNANGSFTYTPDDDFDGTDTFKYKANDGKGDSAEATVTITVSALNDAPVATADTYLVEMGNTLTVSAAEGVLANDSDADGDTLTVHLVANASHGTVTLNADGSFTYAPATGYHGDDSFTYKANDGTTDSATTTVTINVNARPVATDDNYTTSEDSPLTVAAADGLLKNDTDADSEDTLTATIVTQPTNGTLSFNADGSFTYTPEANFHGTDTFTYVVSDGTYDSDEATVTITVESVNDAPEAASDSYSVLVDGNLVVSAASGLLANDTDADGDTLTATVVAQPAHGRVLVNPNGSFEYTPDEGFHGTDTFTYKANDGTTDSDDTTVTITVNTPPAVVDDEYTAIQNNSLVIDAAAGVGANDSDADGDTLTFTLVAQPTSGTVTFNTDGSFTYVPDADFHGTDTFTYKVNDGYVDSAEATVTIDVNAFPVAVNDTYSVDEDTTLTEDAAGGVLKNDTDADDQALTVAVVTQPTHGTLTLSPDGSFTYTPDADYNGPDSFTYIANDGTHDSNEATVTITVNPIDDTPVAVDDAYSVVPNGTLSASDADGVVANDTDADGDSLTASIVDQPTNGSVTLNSDGSFTYEPNQDFHGTDTFTYKINDGTSDSGTATVTIHVNTPPNAVSDIYSVDEDVTLTADANDGVLNNDVDAESDPLTATVILEPSNGTLTLNADGSFTYVPDADFSGEDGFTYVANDGYNDSTETTVVITINPVNDVPAAAEDSYTVPVDGSLSVDAAAGVGANDTDADDDSLTFSVAVDAAHGNLTLNTDGSFDYQPDPGFHGTDTFTYIANDGAADSAETTVTIDVNTLASAVEDSYAVDEDGTLTVDAANGVLNNDSDVDSDTLTAELVGDVSHGTLTLEADGSFVYVPDADFHGTDTFTYVAKDGFGNSAVQTVTITVNPINDAPEAVDDAYPVLPNASLVLDAAAGVRANDTDADDDQLEVILLSAPAHGTLLIGSDGAFTYTPAEDYEGTDSFTYKVNDGTVDSLAATVTLNVDTQAALADQAFADEQNWI